MSNTNSGRPKVYLAGPISGCTYAECTDWRDNVREKLAEFGIDGFSPMRNKEFLREVGIIDGNAQFDDIMCTDKGIMGRDTFDVRTSDAILVNLLGTKIVSIGTVMEITLAYDRRIPVVVAMEPEGNLHEHPMLREAIDFRLPSLEQAVAILKTLFIPG